MNKLFKTMTDAEYDAVYELTPQQDNQQQTESAYTKIMINDLVRQAYIGVYDFEHGKTQPIKINMEIAIDTITDWEADRHENTVCYAAIVKKIDALIAEGHIQLVETFAEKIVQLCLENSKVQNVKIKLEKTEIIEGCGGVGVEIFRTR